MSERSNFQIFVGCAVGGSTTVAQDLMKIESVQYIVFLIALSLISILFGFWIISNKKKDAGDSNLAPKIKNWMRKGEIDSLLLSLGMTIIFSFGVAMTVKAETGSTVTENLTPEFAIFIAERLGKIDQLSDETKKLGQEIGLLSQNVEITSEKMASLEQLNQALLQENKQLRASIQKAAEAAEASRNEAAQANSKLSTLQQQSDERRQIEEESTSSVFVKAVAADFVLGVPPNQRGKPVENIRADNSFVKGLDKWPSQERFDFFGGNLYIDLEVASGLKRDATYSAVLYDVGKGYEVSQSKGVLIRPNDYSEVDRRSMSRATIEFPILDMEFVEDFLVCIKIKDSENEGILPINTLAIRGNLKNEQYRPVIGKDGKILNQVPVTSELEISSPEVLTANESLCDSAKF